MMRVYTFPDICKWHDGRINGYNTHMKEDELSRYAHKVSYIC